MSAFTGPLRVEHLGVDWRRWKLLELLRWAVDTLDSGQYIDVPVGFISDGASIPRLLWWLFPTTGAYLRAAFLHDYLLALLRAGTPHQYASTKAACDRQFRIACQACGVSALRSWTMWAAVRLFGKG